MRWMELDKEESGSIPTYRLWRLLFVPPGCIVSVVMVLILAWGLAQIVKWLIQICGG